MIETDLKKNLNQQETQTISVVFFGRLEERKGLCTFLEAINLLKPEFAQKIKIIFMGKIVPLFSEELKHLNSEQYIQQELGKNFDYQIISNLYSEEAVEYINNLDHPIVCLTSPQDNFPNTALEMGQIPSPLIVSDTGGFHETLQLVQRSEGLYWFKPKDADSLAKMLEEAIGNYPETPQASSKSTLAEINQELLKEKIEYIEKAFEPVKPSEKPQGKVTIGIISQNQGQYLIDCLNSIKAQTYENIEVIVIDDASKDEKSKDQFLDAKSLFPSYQFIQQETSKGKGRLCNHILEIARGDYFLSFNPQVRLFPMAIEKLMETANNNEAAIVTCPQKEIGAVDRIINYSIGSLPIIMKDNVYGGECCLFSRTLLEKFPYTKDKTINSQHWEIICAALATGEKISYYPYPLYEYLVPPESADKKEASAREKYSLRHYLAQIPLSQWSPRQFYLLLTALQQLHYFPYKFGQLEWDSEQTIRDLQEIQAQLKTQLAESQNSIQQLQGQLQQSQAQVAESQNHIQQLQSQWQETQVQLIESQNNTQQFQSQWQETQAQLSESNNHVQQLQRQLQETKARIEAMETSKFWKLRQKWFSLKKKLGLPRND